MTTYRVEKDGVIVHEGETAEYDREAFPPEYRGRPESGEVRLYVDDELIAVQISQEAADLRDADAAAAAAADLEEEGS